MYGGLVGTQGAASPAILLGEFKACNASSVSTSTRTQTRTREFTSLWPSRRYLTPSPHCILRPNHALSTLTSATKGGGLAQTQGTGNDGRLDSRAEGEGEHRAWIAPCDGELVVTTPCESASCRCSWWTLLCTPKHDHVINRHHWILTLSASCLEHADLSRTLAIAQGRLEW